MASYRKLNGKWQARISWYDDDGKRHYKTKAGFSTKPEAKRWARTIEEQKDNGTISAKNISFAAYFKEWFEIYKKNKIAVVTARLYDSIYKNLEEYFGNKKIDKVTRRDYQIFINKFGETHAKVTVKKVHSIIKSVVSSAMYDNLIQRDFTHNIELSWNADRTMVVDYLNMNEINTVIDKCKEKMNPSYTSRYMILTAFYTGFRLSEIAALTWNDINFNWKTITVNKSWNYHTRTFKDTKNASSKRIIRVNQGLLDILKSLQSNNKELVFENKFGTVPTSEAVNKKLRELLKECDIQKKSYHFHSIRHSHVAMLLYNNVDIYAISKRLGHSDITTTTRKYAYMLEELKSKSDSHIEQILDELDTKKDTELPLKRSNSVPR